MLLSQSYGFLANIKHDVEDALKLGDEMMLEVDIALSQMQNPSLVNSW